MANYSIHLLLFEFKKYLFGELNHLRFHEDRPTVLYIIFIIVRSHTFLNSGCSLYSVIFNFTVDLQ